eukprot:5255948-Alexandrium_andersonii.AAC.1
MGNPGGVLLAKTRADTCSLTSRRDRPAPERRRRRFGVRRRVRVPRTLATAPVVADWLLLRPLPE